MGCTKEQAAADFLDFRHTIPGSDITVFSGGPKLENGHAGEVFDTEEEAALAGAQAALSTARFATNMWICLGNLEAATRLLTPSTGSSQEAFESFCALAATWPLRERLPHTKSGSIQVRWVPGHAKIPENETADLAAKEGVASTSPPPHTISYASLERNAKAQSFAAAQTLWQNVLLQTYQDLGITTSPNLLSAQLSFNSPDLTSAISPRPVLDVETSRTTMKDSTMKIVR
ncbi:hypothetical protein TSTA_109170 [Talaromyces stipitatus ATCC 10500]|uniref:Uncharacterized protein n=1 Tax=Talaromyces stipitatus (strain ATCC 10500 / CBS 375.48 / QM 6759 / NRRL 1006) TaxID=441959 RepID=B8MUX0_TALSN|nr:uncharacterized protein TSTA_109170 [Talaromyces stipitatus ATCC 10500]EED11738.1 hypothetical protein TSTA_109170 [Talaromyces stipitatus ATCC 10500]